MIYVYQALPMTGIPEEKVLENIANQRKQIMGKFIDKGTVKLMNGKTFTVTEESDICFLCNYQCEIPESHRTYHEQLVYLGKAVMDLIAKCDVIVMDSKWRNSKGCMCEEFIARMYGIPIITLY